MLVAVVSMVADKIILNIVAGGTPRQPSKIKRRKNRRIAETAGEEADETKGGGSTSEQLRLAI